MQSAIFGSFASTPPFFIHLAKKHTPTTTQRMHGGGLDDWLSPAVSLPSPPPPSPPPSPPPVHAKVVLPSSHSYPTVEEMLHQLLAEQQRLSKMQTMQTYSFALVAVVILLYLDRILHRLPPLR